MVSADSIFLFLPGKSHISWKNLWFPIDFPLSQLIELDVEPPPGPQDPPTSPRPVDISKSGITFINNAVAGHTTPDMVNLHQFLMG